MLVTAFLAVLAAGCSACLDVEGDNPAEGTLAQRCDYDLPNARLTT
jgi:hypothetical protein